LIGRDITIPDLRAGFAYVMAALVAKDSSTISGLRYIDRGYEKLVPKLQSLGGHVERLCVSGEPEEAESLLSSS
jgi:UDP-N-acetylglucosamine 1-carboxyvinyltransferase